MTLRRDVDDQIVAHRADEPLAGARECSEIGGRPTADEYAGGATEVADPLREPPEYRQLQLRQPGAAGPPAAIELEGAGEEVGHGAGPGSEAGDEGQVAAGVGRPR